MQSYIFIIITPDFSDRLSEIIICCFAAQETFLIIINFENNGVLLNIFSKMDSLINRKVQKNSIYLKYKYFVTLQMFYCHLLIR